MTGIVWAAISKNTWIAIFCNGIFKVEITRSDGMYGFSIIGWKAYAETAFGFNTLDEAKNSALISVAHIYNQLGTELAFLKNISN